MNSYIPKDPEIKMYLERFRFYGFDGKIKGRIIHSKSYTCPDCNAKSEFFTTRLPTGKKNIFAAFSDTECTNLHKKLMRYMRMQKVNSIEVVDAPDSVFKEIG